MNSDVAVGYWVLFQGAACTLTRLRAAVGLLNAALSFRRYHLLPYMPQLPDFSVSLLRYFLAAPGRGRWIRPILLWPATASDEPEEVAFAAGGRYG